MFEVNELPENCPNAFYMKSDFPLCVEKTNSTSQYVINSFSQRTAGPDNCVLMQTKVEYVLYTNEKEDRVGIPLMSDTMTFSKEFIEEIFRKSKSRGAHKSPTVTATSEVGLQTMCQTKMNTKAVLKKKPKARKKLIRCNRKQRRADSSGSRSSCSSCIEEYDICEAASSGHCKCDE